MELVKDLGGGPIALDTAVFIYWIEEHPIYLPIVEPVFEAIDRGAIEAVTSILTLLETLVVPLRRGDRLLAEQYEAILTKGRGLMCADINSEIVREAAQLRASHGISTPDALQLATALRFGATAFVTNDRRLQSPNLRTLQLDNYR